MTMLDVLFFVVIVVSGVVLALWQSYLMIYRLRRSIERLEDQIHELRDKDRGKPKFEMKAVAASPTSFKPIVVESLGPPCDPPDSGEPYR